jgi:hypothetical protein
MLGEHIGNCGKVGGGYDMLKTPWELDENTVRISWRTQWIDFWCLYFYPQKITLLPKNYRIISPPAPRKGVAPTSYCLIFTTGLTYLVTYLVRGNCLLYYDQLNLTWRLRKLSGLIYLPRSHGKFSPEFSTCHVDSRTFHVISKRSHWTSLLAT